MPYLHNYRMFISHAWKYSDGYKRIIEFLDAASNFEYSNYSVPVSKAFERMSTAKLQEQIKEQLRPVQVVLILGGMYVAHSDWIQFEIDYAVAMDKPILGITPWAAQRMPDAVTKAATKIVGWNTSTIVAGIRELVP